MAIWVPETIYRLLPLVCLATGFVFTFTVNSFATVTLNVILVSYGVVVLTMRAGYRAHV